MLTPGGFLKTNLTWKGSRVGLPGRSLLCAFHGIILSLRELRQRIQHDHGPKGIRFYNGHCTLVVDVWCIEWMRMSPVSPFRHVGSKTYVLYMFVMENYRFTTKTEEKSIKNRQKSWFFVKKKTLVRGSIPPPNRIRRLYLFAELLDVPDRVHRQDFCFTFYVSWMLVRLQSGRRVPPQRHDTRVQTLDDFSGVE